MPEPTQHLLALDPGPERRTLLRDLGLEVGVTDFSDDEWAEVEAEAPGTRATLQAMVSAAGRTPRAREA